MCALNVLLNYGACKEGSKAVLTLSREPILTDHLIQGCFWGGLASLFKTTLPFWKASSVVLNAFKRDWWRRKCVTKMLQKCHENDKKITIILENRYVSNSIYFPKMRLLKYLRFYVSNKKKFSSLFHTAFLLFFVHW